MKIIDASSNLPIEKPKNGRVHYCEICETTIAAIDFVGFLHDEEANMLLAWICEDCYNQRQGDSIGIAIDLLGAETRRLERSIEEDRRNIERLRSEIEEAQSETQDSE